MVIVVLLIGILGVIQVFPGGFGVIRTTRGNTISAELARSMSDQMKGRSAILAEEIRPTTYHIVNGVLLGSILTDTTRGVNDLLPAGDGLNSAGVVLTGGQTTQLGQWPYVSGANLIRRVIGEGGAVPAPRQVGADFGGLMTLQFAPIVWDPAFPLLLQVYGNDMSRREGDPGFARARPWIYYLEDIDTPQARMHVPVDTVKPRSYRLEFTAWFNNPGPESRDVETSITVAPNLGGGHQAIDFATLPAIAGLGAFVGVEWDSVRLARAYDQVINSGAFTNDPYEYVLLDARLGVLLFNPVGYNYMEPRDRGRRVPLLAKANYDVYDWRIIREEFRIPDNVPPQIKLKLASLKVGYFVGDRSGSGPFNGEPGPDAIPYYGMELPIPRGNGLALTDPNAYQTVDVIVVDQETGGVLLHDPTQPRDPSPPPGTQNDYLLVDPDRSSYAVDKSNGFVKFLDYDDAAPGLQLRIIYPGTNTPVTINADGRMMKVLYQGKGEWAVQVLKAAARYRLTYGGAQLAEYYVGASGIPGGLPTRIYFPTMDAGKNVVIGEIWYRDSNGLVQVMNDQNFTIGNAPFDPLGPYVDIRGLDPLAIRFLDPVNDPQDFRGLSVRHVRGASVSVRVLWNPSTFTLVGDLTENWSRFTQWSRSWRRLTVETFLQKGENN